MADSSNSEIVSDNFLQSSDNFVLKILREKTNASFSVANGNVTSLSISGELTQTIILDDNKQEDKEHNGFN